MTHQGITPISTPTPSRTRLMRWRERLSQIGVGLIAGIAFAFFVLPILAIAWRVIVVRGDISGSLDSVATAIWLSFITTLCTLAITVIFGVPLAYVLARWKFPLRRFAVVLVELPIVLPPAVAGLALLITFGRRGLVGAGLTQIGIEIAFTTAAVILAQTFVSAPFFVRSAIVGFAGVPREIEDAARVDGAAGFALFWRITLPLSLPALSAGLVLAWARALGEFGATLLFAGSLSGRTQTMPLLIYNLIERDINVALLAGVILIGLALIALVISRMLNRTPAAYDAA
jgi:molybdate transport system permease protein